MSKVKSPKEKKELSLQKDRRNSWWVSAAASRISVRQHKQQDHQHLRRAVNQELRPVKGGASEFDNDFAEAQAKDRMLAIKRSRFRKRPDAPLGDVIASKKDSRATMLNSQKNRRKDRETEAIVNFADAIKRGDIVSVRGLLLNYPFLRNVTTIQGEPVRLLAKQSPNSNIRKLFAQMGIPNAAAVVKSAQK